MVKIITYIQCTVCALVFFIHSSVFAQSNSVSVYGQVLDKTTKEPLIGASVSIANGKTGAVSDTEGKFVLSLNSFPVTISVSYLGYQTSKISVEKNSGTVTVFLLEDASILNEIVVVGYGTQRRKELTGAISTVSKAQLEYNVSPTVDGLLSGAVAGVAVTQSSGQPGAPASIRIRGGNSINASNDPLYVIDGFIFFSDNNSTKTGLGAIEGESNPLNLLNPSDIESIEILKDVSATAIYGSRGSNGVIMITTKKGRKGGSSINYQYSAGWSKSAKTLNLLNASQWARVQKDYFLNKGAYSDAEIDQLGIGYDWQNAVLRTGIEQTHSISISGGDEKSRYFLSGNYFTQDGIILNSGFNRFVGRINYDREVFSNLSIGINLTTNKSTQNSLTTFEDVNFNDSPYSHGIANSLTYALYMPPVVPVYNKDGGYNYSNPYEYAYLREGDTTANPVSDLMNSSAQTINTVLLGSFYAKYTIVKGLTAKINLGTNISHTTQNYFAPSYTAVGLAPDGIGGVGNKRQEVFLSEYTLNYVKTWSKIHAIDALAGFTYEDTQTNSQTIQTAKFTNETLGVDNLQDGEEPYPPVTGAGKGELYSILGRLNYSLLGRYHLTANFRSDYSTRFARNHKWGFFPSVGLSWNINEEKFLKDFTALNNLKLRLSTGSVGNQEIGDYEYVQTFAAVRYNGSTAYQSTNTGNDDLKWEITTQYNAGVDVDFLNSRFSATADVYYKKTSDLLLRIPQVLGEGGERLVNAGNITNRGIEFGINAVVVDGRDLRWSVAANIARNINEITKLYAQATDMIQGVEILREGEPLGSFYGLLFDGVVQKNEDVSALPSTPSYGTLQPGDPKFRDVSGLNGKQDNHISADDRVVLGSKQPDFTYGFSTTFHYKGFDFYASLQGSQGNKVYNLLRRYLERPTDAYNISATLLDSWTESNPSNTVPRIVSSPLSSELDSRYVEDASYLRLKTVTLGYTIDKFPFVSSGTPMKIRLFATAQNLFTLSGYKGYDPEISAGIDLGTYPMARTFYIGANVSF